MSGKNKILARRIIEDIFNNANIANLEELVSNEIVIHDTDKELRGLAQLRQGINNLQQLTQSKNHFMKNITLLLLLNCTCVLFLFGQDNLPGDQQRKAITALIDQYSEAREKRDTTLLKTILTNDVDQLVSTGEWRDGIGNAVEGMLKSSASTPGTRTLRVEKIRMFNPNSAIVDCKYEIQNKDGTTRKMWSTFLVVAARGAWKISAIRNMLPSSQ